eukprot:COSAG05_NODE_392_length_10391_cov_8.232899_3_plen_63_part_00
MLSLLPPHMIYIIVGRNSSIIFLSAEDVKTMKHTIANKIRRQMGHHRAKLGTCSDRELRSEG